MGELPGIVGCRQHSNEIEFFVDIVKGKKTDVKRGGGPRQEPWGTPELTGEWWVLKKLR